MRVMWTCIQCVVDGSFVRAWALDSLATFAEDAVLMRFVKRRLSEFERSDSKALQARARVIGARLGSRQVG